MDVASLPMLHRLCSPAHEPRCSNVAGAWLQLSVREGIVLRTRTVENDLNPTWDQRFNLLVDDVDTQSLRAPLPSLNPKILDPKPYLGPALEDDVATQSLHAPLPRLNPKSPDPKPYLGPAL